MFIGKINGGYGQKIAVFELTMRNEKGIINSMQRVQCPELGLQL